MERPSKELFEALAERCGVSGAVFFEHVVANIPLNDEGLPTWWQNKTTEELPIDSD